MTRCGEQCECICGRIAQASARLVLKQCRAVMHGRTDGRTNGRVLTLRRSSRLTLRAQGGCKKSIRPSLREAKTKLNDATTEAAQ
jgi:hypothetical protein